MTFDYSKSCSLFLSSDMAFKAEYPPSPKAVKSVSQPGLGSGSGLQQRIYYHNIF
jgi:hypothetical protein